jgi:signal transduction histidine kinase
MGIPEFRKAHNHEVNQFNNIVLLLFAMTFSSFSTFGESSYSPEQLKQFENVIKHYPYPTEGNDRFDLYLDLYKNYFFANVPARDSLWLIINAMPVGSTGLDSATHEAFQGLEHYFSRAYDQAIPHFTEAIILFEREEYWSGYLEMKRQLFNVTYTQKAVAKAYEGYQEIYEHPHASDYMKSRVIHNMGALLMELEADIYRGAPGPRKDSITAIITGHLKESLALVKEKDSYSKASTYSMLIDVYLENRQFDSALYYTNKSFQMAEAMNDLGGLAFINIKKSALLDSIGSYEASLACLDEAIDYYQSINEFDQRMHALTRKAETLVLMDRPLEAYQIAKLHNRLMSEKMSTEMAQSLAKHQAEFETASKELTIKNQEITISNRTRWILLLALGIVLTLSIFTFFFQRNQRIASQEKAALIIQSKQESINAVIHAQEEERKRIAKDLHDGIVQRLGGLKLGLQNLFHSSPSDEANKLLDVLDESSQELRQLSHQMMPKALSDFGLVPAMNDMLENSLGHTKMKYHFEHFRMEERIDQKKETALYRIAQELVNNVIKHSEATKVNIQLFKNNKQVILIVEDNGKGIAPTREEKGIGLLNIHSRLDTVKGKVNFEPSPNSGTLVTIKIPLE